MVWEDKLYPNLYVVLVGPSGRCRKGTAMGLGERLLYDIDVRLAAETMTREGFIRRLHDAASSHTDPDTGEVINHSSMTVFSKELTVFLGYNNPQFLSDLTDLYDCKNKFEYGTKTEELRDEIYNVWLNLIGATTPSLIQSALPQDAIGTGLTSRMIFVNEFRKAKRVLDPRRTQLEYELEEGLRRDLEAINFMTGEFRITDEWASKMTRWYDQTDDRPPFESRHFEGYFSRRPTHLRKISMIMSASRGDDGLLTAQDFDKSLRLLLATERNMPKVFAGLGKSKMASVQEQMIEFFAGKQQATIPELWERFREDIQNDREMAEQLTILVKIGFIERRQAPDGSYYFVVKKEEE